MSSRDDFRGPGGLSEDEYFHRKDRELLARMRENAEAQRKKAGEDNSTKDYWMRCPKCGSTLKEESYGGVVMVDRCESASCGGIFFDKGELDIVLKAKPSLIARIFGG